MLKGEPDSRCSAAGGYCMQKTKCPQMNFIDNKCPGDDSVKCCLSAPYQEPECEAKGGKCSAECSCNGDLLSGFCPNQPGPIKCCVEEEIVESCTETSISQCIEERKRRKRSTECTSK